MRSPSPRILADTVDIYRLDPTRAGAYDADGGLVAANAYPATPDVSAVPCRVCLDYGQRVEDANGRVATGNGGLIIFGSDPGVSLNDKIVWGTTTLYVDGSTDMAGAGSAWGVPVQGRA